MLFQDCQRLKEEPSTTSSDLLQIENTRKMLKRLTGEVDLVESYNLSLGDLVKVKTGGSRELQEILSQISGSTKIMRDLCCKTSHNVTQGKRV